LNALLIKIALLAALALGIFGAGAGLAWKYQSAQVAAKQDRIEQLAEVVHQLQEANHRAEMALKSARDKRAELHRAIEVVKAQLDTALTANRAWADTPVPKEVQDVLRR
jgi:uncharacterized protein HemX